RVIAASINRVEQEGADPRLPLARLGAPRPHASWRHANCPCGLSRCLLPEVTIAGVSGNSLTEDTDYGHVQNGQSYLPIVSARIALAARPGPALPHAGPRPGLSVPLAGDPRHRGPGRLSLCPRHCDDLPGENRRRTGSLHRAGQLPGVVR